MYMPYLLHGRPQINKRIRCAAGLTLCLCPAAEKERDAARASAKAKVVANKFGLTPDVNGYI